MLGWGGGGAGREGKGRVSGPLRRGICWGGGRKSSRVIWGEWGCGKGDARWSGGRAFAGWPRIGCEGPALGGERFFCCRLDGGLAVCPGG